MLQERQTAAALVELRGERDRAQEELNDAQSR
jgi:hypothetical protein